jgi:hypothetical protein
MFTMVASRTTMSWEAAMMVRASAGWCPRRGAPGAGGLADCRTVMGGLGPFV